MKRQMYTRRKKIYRPLNKSVRHTHNTIAGLEDMNALLNDIRFSCRREAVLLEGLAREIEAINNHVDKAITTLHAIRRGPYSYPTDDDIVLIKAIKPNGRHAIIYSGKEEEN